MKKLIKLVKVKTFSEHVACAWNYGDDYGDLTRHIVSDYSDFEEVTDIEFAKLISYIEKYNRDNKKTGEYIFIVDREFISVKDTLSNILKKENDLREEARKKQKELELKREKENKRIEDYKNYGK